MGSQQDKSSLFSLGTTKMAPLLKLTSTERKKKHAAVAGSKGYTLMFVITMEGNNDTDYQLHTHHVEHVIPEWCVNLNPAFILLLGILRY